MLGVKRLFDLVKVPDQALRCAWYYALGNTLVANDLQQASRIAYGSDKRFSRVVTLKVSITPWRFCEHFEGSYDLADDNCRSEEDEAPIYEHWMFADNSA